jgi:hypothetical protein
MDGGKATIRGPRDHTQAIATIQGAPSTSEIQRLSMESRVPADVLPATRWILILTTSLPAGLHRADAKCSVVVEF